MLEFSRKDMVKVLDGLKDTVDKGVFPILMNANFTGDTVVTYNRLAGSIASFDCKGFVGLVPFVQLYRFLRDHGAETVKVVPEEGGKVTFKLGRAKTTFVSPPADDFPEFGKLIIKFGKHGVKPAPWVNAAVNRCFPFASSSDVQANLNGVFITDDEVFATDNLRIADCRGKERSGIKGFLPAVLARILTRSGGIDKLYIGEQIVAETGIFTYFCPATVVTPPNISRIFPEKIKFVQLPVKELMDGLKRVADISDEVQGEKLCRIDFGNKLRISYLGRVAEFQELFTFGGRLVDFPIYVNPFNFMSMLKACDRFGFDFQQRGSSCGLLYGESEDKTFRGVLALSAEERGVEV